MSVALDIHDATIRFGKFTAVNHVTWRSEATPLEVGDETDYEAAIRFQAPQLKARKTAGPDEGRTFYDLRKNQLGKEGKSG